MDSDELEPFDPSHTTDDELYQFISTTPPDELECVAWHFAPRGARVDTCKAEHKSTCNMNMLHFLATRKSAALFKIGLENCDYIECLDAIGKCSNQTPIDIAVAHRNVPIIRLILDVYPECHVSHTIDIAFDNSYVDAMSVLLGTPQGQLFITSEEAQHMLRWKYVCASRDLCPKYTSYSFHKPFNGCMNMHTLLHNYGFVFDDVTLPLKLAIYNNDIDVFMMLLDRYSISHIDHSNMYIDDPTPVQPRPYSLLHLACWHGCIDFIDPITSRMPDMCIAHQANDGYTALHIAIMHNNAACAEAVYRKMDAKARTIRDNDGHTAEDHILFVGMITRCRNPKHIANTMTKMFARANIKNAYSE